MRSRNVIVLAGLIVAALVISTGCVSKGLYRKDSEANDTRVSTVEGGVEANERRIGDLKTETDSKLSELDGKTNQALQTGNNAMTRADAAARAADKAAKGRLLWEVTLSDDRVRFEFGHSELPDAAKSALDDLVRKAKAYGKAVYVEIEGHTDNVGAEEYNHTLGERRAIVVRNYLNQQGIPLHALNTISYGETKPAADNGTREGRAQNRRVVVKVLE